MNERPIVFSGAMIRAILRAREPKTMTRRTVDLSKIKHAADWIGWTDGDIGSGWHVQDIFPASSEGPSELNDETAIKCPSGAVGDRLWVRETWSPDHCHFYPNYPVVYRANYEIETEKGMTWSPEAKASFPFKWRPSIFMPRHLSRITLEITGIRVERLNAISEADAIAEGVEWNRGPFRAGHTHPISAFKSLWESINTKKVGCAWVDDPWVWVIAFKRLARTDEVEVQSTRGMP